MLTFLPHDGARFSYRADFSNLPYANISFYNREATEILFHLSLRRDEGLAVCNSRGRDAAAWAREVRKKISFSPDEMQVDIKFAPPHVSVFLDGQETFRFGPGLLRRHRFPHLEWVGYADFQGGVRTSSIEIFDLRTPEPDLLTLTSRLELRAQLQLTPAQAADLRLETTPQNPDLPDLILRAPTRDGDLYEMRAVLPGRVWQSVPADAPLQLGMCLADGQSFGKTLTLERAEFATRLEEILQETDLKADAFTAMQIIEHVRFADLETRLSPAARRALAGAAEFYGLHEFLYPGVAVADAKADALPDGLLDTLEQDETEKALQATHARFSLAMREDPDANPFLLLRDVDLPRDAHQHLFLMLSEFFSYRADFPVLINLARTLELDDFTPQGEPWHDSAMLPYLWSQGRITEVRDVIWQLGSASGGWVVTPALAWVMRAVLKATHLDEKLREELIYAYTGFVEKRREDYWARAHCHALTEACVHLLASRAHMAEYLRDHAERFALQSYGLSREFWEQAGAAIKQGTLALSPTLQQARDSFAILQRHQGSQNPEHRRTVAGALDFFDRVGAVDATRMRCELLGPGGVAGAQPDPAWLRQAGRDPGEAALRHMAFPGAAPGSSALAAEAAKALPTRYDQVPRAPYYRLQKDLSQKCSALIARVGAALNLPGEDEIDRLAADMDVLASQRSQFLGFGMALTVLEALIRFDAREAAEQIMRHLQAMHRRIAPENSEAMQRAPAILNALFVLQDTAARSANPLATQALSLFGTSLPNLPAAPVAPLATPPAHWQQTSPMFNTLVVVFSCIPNLETRIPAMRTGWLSLLRAYGIPYVVVVGNGDGRLENDVVHLDAPDDYEGLPQKTLAAIRWVYEHTGFTHLLKIDDDCMLNPEEFFQSQSYRKYDYYGRVLTRRPGQMDRGWHCQKASSLRGQMELDKSPEPSTYTDGGSGYTLSRTAMAAAISATDSAEGQHLIQVSFMEDKLLGDLLALRGITPADEDYRISILRRTHSGAIPVSLWVNSFEASQAAPVKLVHLDAHAPQAAALDKLKGHDLTPKKIWPSYMPVTLGYQSNALEMVSDLSRLEAARSADVAVVACMRNEMFMLPHFLAHYRKLGVGSFLIADNCSDDGTLEYLAGQPDVALFSVDTDYRLSHYGVAWQQALMAAFRVNKWSLVADADELLVWQENLAGNLPDLLNGPKFAKAEAARLFMLDMYPKGRLEEADFASGDPFAEAGYVDREPVLSNWPGQGPFSNMPTWTSALRHRLISGSRTDLFVAQKIALLRYQPWMRLSAGLHFVGDVKLAKRELLFAHFKYNADFRRKARAEVSRRQHFNDAEEYRKYLALVSEGRDVVFDPSLSVRWTESPFVQERLGLA